MSATATVDPALAVRAAVRSLYDRLKDLVDRGPTEDPQLLDELRAITRQDGGRISRAMKKLVAATEPLMPAKQEPAPQPAKQSPVTPASTSAPAPGKQPSPSPTTVPATVPAASRERVSFRLAEQPRPALIPSSRRRSLTPSTVATPRRRHRPPGRRRRWLMPLLLVAATLGLVALLLLSCTPGTVAAQDAPRAPVAVSVRPDAVLTTQQPLDVDAGRHGGWLAEVAR